MLKSFRVGSAFGIPLKLDITLLIVLPVFAAIIGGQITDIVEVLAGVLGTTIDAQPLTAGYLPWILGLAAAIGLFIGVLLHELGHSLVAMHYGYNIDSITLWLLGGMAQFTEQPREWTHEFWIAIAGPLTSIGVGAVCYGIVSVVPLGSDAAIFVIGYLAVLNIGLAVFNMIPAFPLDGGRVLRALYTRTRSFPAATQRAVRIGKLFAFLLGIFGLLAGQIFMIAIAFFIYIAGSAEGRHTVLASVFEDVPVTTVMTKRSDFHTVDPDLPLSELLDTMMQNRHSGYPVTENGDVIGIVTMADLKEVPPEERQQKTVRDVMSRDLQTIRTGTTAMTAFNQLSQGPVGRLLVEDDQGEIVGLVTRTDLVRAFQILQEQKFERSRQAAQLPTR